MPNLVRLLRDKMRMMREDALAVANVVEQAFKGQDELSDDELDADLRQVFYELQDEKILDVRRYEYRRDGRALRGYMWHIRDADLRFSDDRAPPAAPPEQTLYLGLNENAWERHKTPDEDPLVRRA